MPRPDPVPVAVRDAILAWYASCGRTLPFRGTTDPYAILVSEAMAQQTQATRAGEAWVAFMALFPTVQALADVSPADVLRAWQGLGYNRRALNLWRAARLIVDEHGGRVPSDVAALEALPGVGPYTARAVAAIAFGLPVGAVDTNVRRVLGRIVSGEPGALTSGALQSIADAAVPPGRAGAWTHAVMDLGATVCRPRDPDCGSCPAEAWCRHAATIGAAGGSTPRAGRAAPVSTRTRAARQPAAPFESTSRWLRGRIIDGLRSAADGEWVPIDGPIGRHGQPAVDVAVLALANEGLIEVEADISAPYRARLTLS